MNSSPQETGQLSRQRGGLSAELEGDNAILARRAIAGGQQLDRKPDTADSDRTEQLVVCGLASRRPISGGGDEPDSVGQAQRARPACLLERCVDEAADAHEQPD